MGAGASAEASAEAAKTDALLSDDKLAKEQTCEPVDLPPNATSEDVEAAVAKIEQGKTIGKAKFEAALLKLLVLSIDGYPRALRSTTARRNEILRQHDGDQDESAEDVKAQAADLKEEGKTWMMGLVPILGLPASILYPAWRALRRCSLLAGIFGHDLNADETKAKILSVFANLRGVVVAEYALEKVVQAVWVALAGPVAGFVPVGMLASKVANVEGCVMAIVGRDTFSEGRRIIPLEEYEQVLDPEPTSDDYLSLMKDSTMYGVVLAGGLGGKVIDVAKDKEQREAAVSSVLATGATVAKDTADTAKVLGKGAVAAAKDPEAKDKAVAAASEAKGKAVSAVAGAAGAMTGALLGKSKK